ncbi:flagellar biosynthesis anti-sigma factor FlgM [Meridianimarinicoccus sp. RP-17]|uniref:flagellar biosynthesis anti-sigma factor FlgM n=1 Tax=Meridianimarinicoccus zhengii TaxID=2056810 RepID=UPI000DAD11B1|nr:flagellar biosynthesis anti-sigma factor FlgM [Phycocomes zhengii]
MVDQISAAGRARLVKIDTDTPTTRPTRAAPGPNAALASEEVSLSKAAGQFPKGMDAGPPFDLDTVKRIKAEIADGNYPINVDRIADSLFESYHDMIG